MLDPPECMDLLKSAGKLIIIHSPLTEHSYCKPSERQNSFLGTYFS